MIYLETTAADGSAVYFDVYAAERHGRGLRVSGTIGDGHYEGEVLVEVGRSDEVTFADAWLGGAGLDDFLARCGAEVIARDLIEVVRNLQIFHARRPAPHVYAPPQGGARVCESGPLWEGVA